MTILASAAEAILFRAVEAEYGLLTKIQDFGDEPVAGALYRIMQQLGRFKRELGLELHFRLSPTNPETELFILKGSGTDDQSQGTDPQPDLVL
jgi:hypothetical protein